MKQGQTVKTKFADVDGKSTDAFADLAAPNADEVKASVAKTLAKQKESVEQKIKERLAAQRSSCCGRCC